MRLPAHLLRTTVAQSASDLAVSFNLVFGKRMLAPAHYVPEMMTPEGQSTGGGKQAMQRLRLVPLDAGFTNLVFGSAVAPERTVELRTFEALDEAHRAHFGDQAVQLERAGYATLVLEVQGFFEKEGFTITLVEPSEPSAPRASPGAPRSRNGLMAGFALGAAAVVLAATAFYLAHR